MTTRRQILAGAASAALLPVKSALTETAMLHNMGGAPAGFPMHNRGARDSGKPFDFTDYCHNLGFGVVELPEGLRVITRLSTPTADWTFGQPMRLHIVELGAGDDAVTTWEFTP